MLLKLTNTFTNKLEVFTPLDNKNVRIYVCGPTVYDNPHIGNGRALVVYDILYRIILSIFGKKHVTFVRNITDIDDKIIDRANELNISLKELTDKVTIGFKEDANYLNCLAPTFEPKATETITEMINIIEMLIKNDNAYYINGHVYFSTNSYKEYGKLAGKELDQLMSGARVEIDHNKKHPTDFVLWKPAAAHEDNCSYDSPWGKGRPGWHIECSAMSHKFLGADFDVHGGGADLMFPHHTNEIAQSCCAFEGSKFAKYWVHNGFLTVGGEKMSKSLGNFVTILDCREKKIKGEVIRLLLLNTHYRAPLDYNEKNLYDAKDTMDYFYRSLQNIRNKDIIAFSNLPSEFLEALLNDLNIHKAISIMLEIAKKINKAVESEQDNLKNILYSCGKILGFFESNYEDWFVQDEDMSSEINQLIYLRKEAKIQKNWQEADRIRNLLNEKKVVLEDKPDGSTSWFIKY